ncbi:MAG: DUF1595 domain-containing protein, partial [Myxococcales bacterium]|nr:DUF1595 domain-containing protein [Myxococcales bacterium]
MATVLGCGLGDAGERPRTRTALPPGVLGGDAADGTGADSLRARDGLGAPGQLPSGTFADAMEACQDELAAFDRTLLQPLFSVRCVGCHNSDGVAGGTRLVLELDPANLSANYDAAATVAATEVAGRSLLVLKPTGEHPDGHTGGTLIAPNSAERERLSAFVAQVKTHACDPPKESSAPCRAPTPGRRQLRRLSRSEYQASVEDLLGISSEAERRFAADTFVHGFDNSAEALLVGPLLADQIAGEAERLAALAMEDLGGLLPCEVSEGDACASEFVRSFGRRAYRRPLTDTEVERYMEVHRAGSQDGGFESGLELVLSTMLQA